MENSWNTFNCEINLTLTWSTTCVIVSTVVADQGATFSITDAKIHVPVVTLSTQELYRTISCSKYQSEKGQKKDETNI